MSSLSLIEIDATHVMHGMSTSLKCNKFSFIQINMDFCISIEKTSLCMITV